MPVCENIPPGEEKKYYYTGKEKTPKGRGYCASFEEGKCRKGLDGNMYQAKNGRWVKVEKRITTSRGDTPSGQYLMAALHKAHEKGGKISFTRVDLKVFEKQDPQRQFQIIRNIIANPTKYDKLIDYMLNTDIH